MMYNYPNLDDGMSDPEKRPQYVEVDKNIVKLDPGTVVAIVAVLILLPLLITGFLAH